MSPFASRGIIDLLAFHPVDKVIISQDSFGRFVNDICPGAYQSMTHVNFKALDDLSVRPLGIYGSKSEIVRYLKDLDLISHDMYADCLQGTCSRADR